MPRQVLTTESNVINDSSSNENATEMLIRTASSNNIISQNLLMENEHMINCGSECSVVNTACSAAADNTVILDLTQEEFDLLNNNENHKLMNRLLGESVSISQSQNEKCQHIVSFLQKKSTANEIVQENVNVDKIWKEELHFPRVETSKKKNKKRNIESKIYAINSEERKKQHEKKIRKQEKQQREKELRKLKKEIKKKIKQEEIKTKKKEREAKKEL
ncbi:19.5g1 protein [Lasius niger]|uniref:19.5g1 protein n=1 Tax=Lasius niger TaxID=67767 RepID=A0A0J7KAG3_LASNI|nr:19.5g1 protein [Lasius niger]